MERTTQLGLYKLDNGDYANHWETPMNANAQIVEDEFVALRTELLDDATSSYVGKLAGTAGSLEERLDEAMDSDGYIIYNDGDLDKSCHEKDGFETTDIHERLANVDRREFVNARLRYLQRNVVTGTYLKKRETYAPADAIHANNHVTDFSLGLMTSLFGFETDFVDPSQAGGVLTVNKTGWCSIAGQLYYGSNPVVFTLAAATGGTIYLSQEPAAAPTVDCRIIRAYNSPYGGGTFGAGEINTTANPSLFLVADVDTASVAGENNNWLPEPFQVLRIELPSGAFEEHLIKSVGATGFEIYGEFTEDLIGVPWWVMDYTAPCVSWVEFTPGVDDLDVLLTYSIFGVNLYMLPIGQFMYDPAVVLAPFQWYRLNHQNNLVSRFQDPNRIFVDMTSAIWTQMPAVTGNYYCSQSVGADFPIRVKNISIVVMEKWTSATSPDPTASTTFQYAVNPMLVDGSGPRASISMYKQGDANYDTWFDLTLLAPTIQISVVNATSASLPWTDAPYNAAGLHVYNTRLWWGVLIEYA